MKFAEIAHRIMQTHQYGVIRNYSSQPLGRWLTVKGDKNVARYQIQISVCLLVTTVIVISTCLASSTGAGSGFSGGPSGYLPGAGGGNCTSCHEDFVQGPGRVEIMGAPRRYRTDTIYDLIVRITDAGQKGAGFELSAENSTGHIGNLIVSDSTNTALADGGNPDYITHTKTGVKDSIANWTGNGGSHEYNIRWQAPSGDAGQITLFSAGNAINDAMFNLGDHYYQNYATMDYAIPGDGDGDGDHDLRDFALLQRCFNGDNIAVGVDCEFVDMNQDEWVSLTDWNTFKDLLAGPTNSLPVEYVKADGLHGGLLYNEWWVVNGAPEPVGDHPLYPMDALQTGSTTFRCQECHGWDYKGLDGAYSTGSHYTGIKGIFNTTKKPQEIYNLLKADPNDVPNGHDMDTYGLSNVDLWDLVKFSLESTIETDDYIDNNNFFIGNTLSGNFDYGDICFTCHGNDGKKFILGHNGDLEFVGTVAVYNPWEFIHNVRFGHPAASMPAGERLFWSLSKIANIGAHAQTLPVK